MISYNNLKIATIVAVVMLIVVGGLVFYSKTPQNPQPQTNTPLSNTNNNTSVTVPTPVVTKNGDLTKFTSEQDFKDYLSKVSELSSSPYYGSMMATGSSLRMEAPIATGLPNEGFGLSDLKGNVNLGAPQEMGSTPDRVSTTNVQVTGIDEPDILKTDGKQIYYSLPQNYYYGGMRPIVLPEMGTKPGIMPPPQKQGGVKTIKAFPPADLSILSSIDASGDMLLVGNTLVVFTQQYPAKIEGYNISDPKQATKTWTIELKDNAQLVGARLYKDRIYLVTRIYVAPNHPCPIEPILFKGAPLSINCVDIYHPTSTVPVDVTYTAVSFDPQTGEQKDSVSFLGSSSTSTLYMSGNAIYVTYAYPGDVIGFLFNFVKGNTDLFPNWMVEKINKLQGYDLSLETKMTEFMSLMQKYESTLSNDDRMRNENELENRMKTYSSEHGRELELSGIVKINVADLKVAATGAVSGQPLNQFALDEYGGYLRIATTIGNSGGIFGSMGNSVSDVYVLDSNLKITGSVKDLGKTERIYSVRFVDDKGYVVTFRQTDPFYVIDLSNPNSPELKGELKIPGFSSYLHPIAKDRILGVGQEGGKVKLSLFDVSVASEPKELQTYNLDDYWSEVQQTHHAFLLDDKHKIFFMPGGKGGYIFSYEGDKLKLVKAVSEIQARRALYLNDYLYVVGDNKIVVLSETDWERLNQLSLQ